MDGPIRDVVIVGGGLAAAKAAETLRAEGFDGRVTVLSDEPDRPYDRPPLSKDYLLGKKFVDDVFIHPPDFYDRHDIALHLGDPVTGIDRRAGQVTTASTRRLAFDRLLLATGARARRLPLGDGSLDGVVVLRTLADSRQLGEHLRSVGHVTVIGAGWIGCEVAATARTLGVAVTLVDPLEAPLARVLGSRVGHVFADLHADHGVDLRLGVGVSDVRGADTVEQVVLTDGRAIDTGLVVTGIGVVPRVDVGQQAGLEVDDGIMVDQTLATTDPRIFAAGDVARAWNPLLGGRLRVEHWANALNQGQTAGRNLLGAGTAYDRLPYFFSDQYDLGMEYSGHAPDWDDIVFRGTVADREFCAFWIRGGRVAAGMNVNVWDVVDDIQALIRSGAQVHTARLADPDVPLSHVAAP